MKNFILILSIFLCLSCKSKIEINQKINKSKEGLWIEKTILDSNTVFISKGCYKNNLPIKTWKHYYNKKIYRKEKFIDSICKTKNYHKNGKLESKGFTKQIVEDQLDHWFYAGKWCFYDEKRKLLTIKIFYKGKVVLK